MATLIAISLMVYENNRDTDYGLESLESVGKFVTYMGSSIIGCIIFVILLLILIVKSVRRYNNKKKV